MRFIDTEQIEKVIREMIAGFSLPQIELNDVLDIIIISIIIYQVIKWVQLTRAWTLFKGIVVLLVCALFASLLQHIFLFSFTPKWIILRKNALERRNYAGKEHAVWAIP